MVLEKGPVREVSICMSIFFVFSRLMLSALVNAEKIHLNLKCQSKMRI